MNSKIITAVVVFAALLAVPIFGNMFGIPGLAALPVFLFCIIMTGRPKLLLTAFWFYLLVLPAVEAVDRSLYIKVIEQGSACYLLAMVVAHVIITKERIRETAVMNRILLAFLVLMGMSIIANRVPPKSILFFCLTYLKHFWIFYFVLRHASDGNGRKAFFVIVFSFALQMVFNLASYAGINPLPHIMGRSFVDYSLGTVGSSHHVGYYMIAFLSLLFAYLKQERLFVRRVACYIAAIVGLVQFYFTFTIHAYPLLVAALTGQHIVFSSAHRRRIMQAVAAATIILAVLTILPMLSPKSQSSGQVLSVERVERRWEEMIKGTKGQAYSAVFLRADDYVPYPWLGGGPGNYTSIVAFITRRPLAWLPHISYFSTTFRQKAVRGGSISSVPWTGMITIFGELGPFGLLLFWSAYIYAALRIWRQSRAGMYVSKYRIILAEAFVPTMAAFIVLNVLLDTILHAHLNTGLWIWGALVWYPCPDAEPPASDTPPPAGETPPPLTSSRKLDE